MHVFNRKELKDEELSRSERARLDAFSKRAFRKTGSYHFSKGANMFLWNVSCSVENRMLGTFVVDIYLNEIPA